jgi:IclR family transcriptional regulator, acetate operon repressor
LSRSNGTQSIDRAAELLSLVVHADEPQAFSDLVDETGLARSTASRVLNALERHHLLERDQDGAFRPGPLFAAYAARHDPIDAFVRTAEPVMARLGEQTGETVNLAIPHGSAVVQVAQVDSTYLLGAVNWVGVDVPPHCSALGKVMYAHDALPLPDDPLERPTERTVADVAALMRELARVRQLGYAETHGELEEGLGGVAAPVRFRDGRVRGALGISGPDFRLDESAQDLGDLLVVESTRLSGLLGSRQSLLTNQAPTNQAPTSATSVNEMEGSR